IPDQELEISSDFNLIQQMPFSKKIIINLNAGPEIRTDELFNAADRLIRSMTPPYFSRVVSGPDMMQSEKLYVWLLSNLPNLAGEADIEAMKKRLTSPFLKKRLNEIHEKLISPEGIVLKNSLQNDPLNLSAPFFEKFRYLNPAPNLRPAGNRFLSSDGRNTLVIAETPVETTDFREGKNLLGRLETLIAAQIPEAIHASYITAHRYAVSNAERIKEDIWIVLGASSILLSVICLIFMRSAGAVFVYLLPFCSLGLATAGTAMVFRETSAITIGFGAVLLGISVDYGVHVYFALRRSKRTPDSTLREVSRPILFSGFTTLAAFGVLLFSDLPGQRQMAVFTMTGIFTSLLLSLIVLPQIIRSNPSHAQSEKSIFKTPSPTTCRRILLVWILIMGVCIWKTAGLSFEGDLRSFNFVSKPVLRDELQLKKVWGDMRRYAMISVHQPEIESALEQNDLLFSALSKRFPDNHMISISPFLPSSATQSENRRRWSEFWSHSGGKTILDQFKKEMASDGFSETAFAPFFNRIPIAPGPILPESLKSFGLGPLFGEFLIQNEAGIMVATLVPDTPEMKIFTDQLKDRLPGIRFISQSRFHEVISSAVSRDFIRFLTFASVAILILVSWLFRNRLRLFLALIPVASGLVIMAGIMGMAKIPFNMFNIIATILVIGLGVDYGIFMVFRLTEYYGHDTEQSILVSGLTTLAGFGALSLAEHPALRSIGITVLIGIGAAIPSALWVIPSIYSCIRKEKSPEKGCGEIRFPLDSEIPLRYHQTKMSVLNNGRDIMRQLHQEILSSLLEKPDISDDGSIIGRFCFRSHFIGFSGHFPGYPILPAFIQLLCASILVKSVNPNRLIPVRIEKAKFLKEIRPDAIITVECQIAARSPHASWKIRILLNLEPASSFFMGFEEIG
ncbi:MAG: MMPL family transporter, partial [Thermodesulfobacteriota bacterium]